jgi:hypothetical protein
MEILHPLHEQQQIHQIATFPVPKLNLGTDSMGNSIIRAFWYSIVFLNKAIRLGELYSELVHIPVPDHLSKAIGFFYKYQLRGNNFL